MKWKLILPSFWICKTRGITFGKAVDTHVKTPRRKVLLKRRRLWLQGSQPSDGLGCSNTQDIYLKIKTYFYLKALLPLIFWDIMWHYIYIYSHIYIYINHIIHTLYIIHFSFHTSQIAWRLPACVQVFLDRLSRVISSVETRASQYLDIEENEVANLGASWSILRNGFFKCQRPSRKSRYEMVSNVHLVLFLQGFYFESDPILMATCFTAVY